MAAMVIEMRDFSELLETVPVGHWAALSKDESAVLATDPDLGLAIKKANDAGEDEPTCYFRPDESKGMFVY